MNNLLHTCRHKPLDNKKGVTIIVAIFIVGFLLVLTTGIFNLVLREMVDTRGTTNYLKSYAGAEGAMELGLLSVKKNGYGFDSDLSLSESGSEVLSFNTLFDKRKDTLISYTMDVKTDHYQGKIGTGASLIIPLFWKEKHSSGSLTDIVMTVTPPGLQDDIIWNIIGNGEGMSGSGKLSYSDLIKYRKKDSSINTSNIKSFLSTNTQSYLLLFNKNLSNEIDFSIGSSSSPKQFFSKPVGIISSSSVSGKYKQNISTTIDNTEFLKMLKYSIYSQ